MPKISIIIPNYNYEHYLRQRIESVMSQTFTDYEIIFLDDCSTDGSREIINEYRDHPKVSAVALNDTNTGSPFMQWKRGLDMATGEFVWIAESDDYCLPCFLEVMAKALDGNRHAAFAIAGSQLVDETGGDIGTDYDGWDEDGSVRVYSSHEYIRHFLLWRNTAYNASMIVFRRTAYAQVSDWFAGMRFCADWRFWIEMALNGDVVEVRRKMNRFRQHTNRVTVKSDGTEGQLREKMATLEFLYALPFIGRYRRLLSKGAFYKEISRTNASRQQKAAFFDMAKHQLGVSFVDYAIERTMKTLSQMLPFITTPSNDRFLHEKKQH